MTTMHNLVPMLGVADICAARDFYCERLGFTCTSDNFCDDRLTWVNLERGGSRVMLTGDVTTPDGETRRASNRHVMLYIYIDDAETLRAELDAAGCRPSPVRETFYGMKEFEVVDPDGYQLLFGEDLDPDGA